MLNHILVDAYGSKISLTAAGQVTLKSANKIFISAYDSLLVPKIAEAIRDGGMSLNPTVEGNSIVVTIPKPSKESRDLLVKTAAKSAEKVDLLIVIYI
jgi:ribosome recycling factor